MTLIEERSTLSGISDFRKDKTGEKENLWTKILGEVQSGERTKLASNQSIIVLGDNESGKTTLIAKLQGNEDPKKGSGLEYGYIDVRDEYRDDHTRLGVWILDGDTKHADLLQFAVNEDNWKNTLVVLCVSMTTPWSIMNQLHMWASTLQDHIDKLKMDPDEYKSRQHRTIKLWKDYIEPGDEMESSTLKRSSRDLDDELFLPLPENVLTRNLGLHVVVVITKTDYMATLEKDFDYKEEHFDFMQQSVRKFCLQYGAALFYTSVKEDKNCDVLYKYLVHKIYAFPFKTPALVVEKDAVFIPAGWDNEKKISILYENLHSMKPEDYFTDVIDKPQTLRKAVTREVEIQAEDENCFLARHLSQVYSGGVAPAGITSSRQDPSLRQSAAVQRTSDRRSSNSSPNQIGSPKKIETTKPGVTSSNEGVLANFFNALLTKKTGNPSSTSVNRQQNVNASAELDRITKGKKTSESNQNSLEDNASEC